MLHTRGEVFADAEGNAVRMVGTCWDITDLAEATQARERLLSLLQATIEATADGIVVVDRDRKVVIRNRRFLSLWKVPPELAACDRRGAAAHLDAGRGRGSGGVPAPDRGQPRQHRRGEHRPGQVQGRTRVRALLGAAAHRRHDRRPRVELPRHLGARAAAAQRAVPVGRDAAARVAGRRTGAGRRGAHGRALSGRRLRDRRVRQRRSAAADRDLARSEDADVLRPAPDRARRTLTRLPGRVDLLHRRAAAHERRSGRRDHAVCVAASQVLAERSRDRRGAGPARRACAGQRPPVSPGSRGAEGARRIPVGRRARDPRPAHRHSAVVAVDAAGQGPARNCPQAAGDGRARGEATRRSSSTSCWTWERSARGGWRSTSRP